MILKQWEENGWNSRKMAHEKQISACEEVSTILGISVVLNEQCDQNILQMFVFKGSQS